MRTIAADPKHLGAEIGMIAVLHTWGQNLCHHPHVHCIVPGGGLSRRRVAGSPAGPASSCPSACSPASIAACSGAAAGRVRAGALSFFGELAALAEPAAFADASASAAPARMGRLCQATVRRPAAGARVSRPLHPSGGHRQQPPDRARGRAGAVPLEGLSAPDKPKVMTLDGRRVHPPLPAACFARGFRRIRHFGFLANTHRPAKLAVSAVCSTCPRLTAIPASDYRERYALLTGRPLDICPCCGGAWSRSRPSPERVRPRRRPGATAHDRPPSSHRHAWSAAAMSVANDTSSSSPRPSPVCTAAEHRRSRQPRRRSPYAEPVTQSPGHPPAARRRQRGDRRRSSRTLCPSSTPIDLRACRGFVQSGFNDVPHRAVGTIRVAGPR